MPPLVAGSALRPPPHRTGCTRTCFRTDQLLTALQLAVLRRGPRRASESTVVRTTTDPFVPTRRSV